MKSIKLPDNPKICIMRLSAIGDVCHAVSTVQAIQKHYPMAKVTWIIGKIEYQLLKNLPNINFIIFDKSKGLKAYRELKQSLKGQKFDILLQMQLAFRANLAGFFIPAKIKLGFSKARSKELHSLFTNRHIKNEKGFHVLDGFRDFARAIGVPDSKPEWNIPYEQTTLDWAKQQLPQKNYMVISPAASKAERDWLTERYAEIADYCLEHGLQVILTGSPAPREVELGQKIQAQVNGDLINLVGKTNLQELLLTLRNAQFVLAPDSGPAHMAVTQNTPVIGLYAHSNPKRTGPYLYQNLVADAYTIKAIETFQTSAEDLDWGLRLKGDELMSSITVDQVKTLIHSLLKS